MAELHKDYLSETLGKQAKHDVGKALDLVPFLSKRTRKIRGNFNNVLGEFVRGICNLKLDLSTLDKPELTFSPDENTEEDQFIWHIVQQVEFHNEDDKYDFVRFLKEYLFNKDSIKIIHPFLFNYIRVEKKDQNEFSKYGEFMNDVLIRDKEKFQGIFKNNDTEDILTELIINQNEIIKELNVKESKYDSLLQPITNLYEEDILFLSNYKDYFLKSFSLLTHFYVFMYICQLVIKFESFSKADFGTLNPLYFTLEWERLSRRRKAVDDLNSFKFIKTKLDHLFPHIHTLSQLSHNKANIKENELNSTKNEMRVLTYPEIKQLVEDGSLDEEKFLSDLRDWMRKYSTIFHKEFKEEYTPLFQNIDQGMEELFSLVNKGTSDDVSKKYGGNLEDLGANQFIKSRGSIGQVLNITHEFLILLTAVSVKTSRIPLNQLFEEFEKRGILLDRYSKSEVVHALDRLNLIDKKSDSGDAQYVKPIL
ncbi:DNA phosphorothioation-dependent restriction protein DptG [Oceanobacillus luteolus]|uniref:DNA phosphorothioation-dependent restriction protein DptG n=1 Tax=Oceanobacillus luteolus TaxID=1274358 RepID=UPI00203A9B20|nr:DNA phosphorothioation-dependent restriction protein DptG [Oceanobacillus luteolus]